jgi:hypothetical protein
MTVPAIGGFVAGCAGGGLLEIHFKLWALVFPVVMAVIAVPLGGGISRSIPATKSHFPRAKQAFSNSITVPQKQTVSKTATRFCISEEAKTGPIA